MADITFGTFGTTVVAIGGSPSRRPDAARQLDQAGFTYLREIGMHELPAGIYAHIPSRNAH
ncbi:hypothetical protein [Kitasatospora sp. NPDC001095]